MAEQTDPDVAYVAKLARISLTNEETSLFQAQLGEVLAHAQKLQQLDVSNVESTAHAVPVFNVFREDESRDWFTAEEALCNAPQETNNLFRVPKVVE